MDWQSRRARALAEARCVVVKVGSAVLTKPQGLDTAVIDHIVAQLAALRGAPDPESGLSPRRVVLVSSGAVAAGRAALGTTCDTASLAARQGAAAVGQSRLMHAYDSAFARHGIVSAQVLLTRDDLRSRQRFLNVRNTFAELLHWGVIPVINENDTVSTLELRFGDNDNLASLLVNLVEADLFINLTTAGGVLAANPLTTPDAAIMPCIKEVRSLNLDTLCGGKSAVGTGGMYSKLRAAQRAAQLGVPTLILPGKEADVITQAFESTIIDLDDPAAQVIQLPPQGTWICPEEHSISRRKFWLAYQSEPAGTITVDDGAAYALSHNGSSLLPGGITAADGNFQAGSLVRVMNKQHCLGVGLSNYAAPQLRRIMGLKRHEVAAALGDAHYPEVIHRDNLLLEAAV
ncbi:MAG: glutamate 5-kinase [Desulfovibrionaceae bacterium]